MKHLLISLLLLPIITCAQTLVIDNTPPGPNGTRSFGWLNTDVAQSFKVPPCQEGDLNQINFWMSTSATYFRIMEVLLLLQQIFVPHLIRLWLFIEEINQQLGLLFLAHKILPLYQGKTMLF